MSTLRVTTLATQAGVEVYTCKAWVNFNGTGTVAIRASGNVSSITDNGTGDYTINFTTAMPDANYTPVSFSAGGIPNLTNFGVMVGGPYITLPTTTAYRLYCSGASALYDAAHINVAIFC